MLNMCMQPRAVPFQQYINKSVVREKMVYALTDSLKSKVHHTSFLSVDILFVQGLCHYLVHCPGHLLLYSMSAIVKTNLPWHYNDQFDRGIFPTHYDNRLIN